MFYLIYGGISSSSEVVDHIHSKSRLLDLINREQINISEERIDSVANLELLSRDDNGKKSDKLLIDWLNSRDDRQAYLERHLIPDDESLWKPSNFKQFLRERAKLIADKINASMK